MSIPAVIFTKESYRRLEIDMPSTINSVEDSDSEDVGQPYSILA